MSNIQMPTTIEDLSVGTTEQEESFIRSDVSFDLSEEQLKDVEQVVTKTQSAQPAPPAIRVKPKVMTARQFVEAAQETDKAIATAVASQDFDPAKGAQVLTRDKTPVKKDTRTIDWSKLDESAIYNDSIPIEAKPFAADDSLRIVLKDQNYVARWVNKNHILLGKARGAGFTYITTSDLAEPLQLSIVEDASGQLSYIDVVAMKIPKSIYYAALKAAHQRAVNTVNNLASQKAARKQAMDLLVKQAGSGVSEEFEAGRVGFYTPGIEI